ncbi:N-acetylmuramoyl-L-alanine amidase [Cylindrospermum sp. FACHB-282]|uniref:N-acetylmuramoyl-L-alanine amidase n=1 Tax=Cylindrospermum sp. FACHB-282 TaxID=2692794 RepID=UPI001682E0AE|nr:peptidoglycan recognition family protein [Cylindrospermum sp. FACHB-282]MBD2385695.1 N-acetylmuramoyl-L-alanine amidase [Cylindrospermum sp. FACHB-282]
MRFKDWASRVMLIFLMFAALILALFIGKGTQLKNQTATLNPDDTVWNQYPTVQFQSATASGDKSQSLPKSPVKTNKIVTRYTTTQAFARYRPSVTAAAVDPSNYGERYAQDVNGLSVNNQAIIVIHETSNSVSSAINFFQTPHSDENVQASYHAMIKQDGTVIYLVPPSKRAFGAANSIFYGVNGAETVQTNPNLPPSVNNFAYHVSLETPPDAWGNSKISTHSGYSEAQYNSLAWLIAQSQVPDERITTHRLVDRSGRKVDPVSFDFNRFFNSLRAFRQLKPINTANRVKKP